MLERDVRQLGRPAAQGLQGDVDPRQEEAALVGPALGDDADGGGRAHVYGDDGGREFLQGRHGVGHDVRPHLGLHRQADVQSGFDPRADDHGGLAQKAGQRLFHHEVQRRDHAAKDSAGDILVAEVVEGEEIHQVDADLVGGLPAVRVQRGQETKVFLLVKQPNGGVGVAHVDGKQHGGRSFLFCLILIYIVSRVRPSCKSGRR